jgi:tight adherence protein C
MATYEVLIPPLLCALGLLIWSGHSYASGTDELLSQSRIHVRTFPDKTHVKSRLEQMGRGSEYENFRLKQISWASIGAGIVFILALVLIGKPFASIILSGLGGIGIYLLIDKHLSREMVAYRLEIESEFASIIEMLTLSLSAGETPLNAITRISLRAHGLLASEFGRVIELVREGHSFHASLDALGRRVDSVVIRRFVDSLITAMQRGAPLIEVLQRHAGEARQNQRNILMDKAGKAEISMMIPVVFLILPISVLFALWPSLTHLNLFAA